MHWLTSNCNILKIKIQEGDKMKKLLDSFVNIFLVAFSIALVGVMIALPVILLCTCIAIVDKQPTTFELVKVAIKGAVVIYLVPKFLKTIFLVYKVSKSEYKKFKEYKQSRGL